MNKEKINKLINKTEEYFSKKVIGKRLTDFYKSFDIKIKIISVEINTLITVKFKCFEPIEIVDDVSKKMHTIYELTKQNDEYELTFKVICDTSFLDVLKSTEENQLKDMVEPVVLGKQKNAYIRDFDKIDNLLINGDYKVDSLIRSIGIQLVLLNEENEFRLKVLYPEICFETYFVDYLKFVKKDCFSARDGFNSLKDLASLIASRRRYFDESLVRNLHQSSEYFKEERVVAIINDVDMLLRVKKTRDLLYTCLQNNHDLGITIILVSNYDLALKDDLLSTCCKNRIICYDSTQNNGLDADSFLISKDENGAEFDKVYMPYMSDDLCSWLVYNLVEKRQNKILMRLKAISQFNELSEERLYHYAKSIAQSLQNCDYVEATYEVSFEMEVCDEISVDFVDISDAITDLLLDDEVYEVNYSNGQKAYRYFVEKHNDYSVFRRLLDFRQYLSEDQIANLKTTAELIFDSELLKYITW